MIYECLGPMQYVKDPETGIEYELGRMPCGKSLDATIAKAVEGLTPGAHTLKLVCPCEQRMTFPVHHVVEGTPVPAPLDFSKLKPVSRAVQR